MADIQLGYAGTAPNADLDELWDLVTGQGAVPANRQAADLEQYIDNNAVFNVRDFGDGGVSGDFSSAVNDAMEAMTATLPAGTIGRLHFPKGVFGIGSNVRFEIENLPVTGEGDATVIRQLATGYDAFTVAAHGVSFSSMRFDGASTSEAGTIFGAIVTDETVDPEWVKITDCRFSGVDASHGWQLAVKFNSGANYGLVDRCRFERLWGASADSGYGVLAGEAKGLRITNCRGKGSSGRGRHMVYLSAGASDCLAALNYIEAFRRAGISQFSQGIQNPCKRNVYALNHLVGCEADGTSTAGAIQIAGHASDTQLLYNTIMQSGRNGISVYNFLLADLIDTVLRGNQVIESQYYGIWASGVKGCQISGGKVRDSSQVSAGTYSDIHIESDDITPVVTTNVKVRGNRSPLSVTKRAAVTVASSTNPPTGVMLSGNDFEAGVVTTVEVHTGIVVTGGDVIGTFTPALKFGGNAVGLTTSTNRGQVVVDGQRVTVTLQIRLTAKGSSTGNAEIYGIPYNANTQDISVAPYFSAVTYTGTPEAYFAVSFVGLQQLSEAGVRTNMTDANFANDSEIRLAFTYLRA